MFKTIIWATDGSGSAEEALPFAKALVEEGGELVVVHSNEIFVGMAGGFPVLADEPELEAKFRRDVDELRAEGFDASFKLVRGPSANAAHVIAEVARKVGADLIVVGTRGHGPVAGLLVGSVTQRLLHVAPCPVLAVPGAKQRAKNVAKREHAMVAS